MQLFPVSRRANHPATTAEPTPDKKRAEQRNGHRMALVTAKRIRSQNGPRPDRGAERDEPTAGRVGS